MKAQVLAHFPMTWMTCIALVIFFTSFVSIFVRAYAKSNSDLYKKMGHLPLSEEDERHE